MRAGKSLSVSSADICRLKALVRDRNAPQKQVWRAEIVLLTADGVGTNEIMRRTGKSKTCVWRWQERFIEAGFDGLLRDKTRPSRIPPLSAEAAERVVALTLGEPPGETTHWTGFVDGEGGGAQRQFGSTYLAQARPPAAPDAPVQALQRSALRRQIARRRRALCRSARARHRPVGRREEPNSGAGPHPARTAAEEGPRRNDDTRLRAARNDDAVRRDERPRRHGDRPQHAAPSPSGVHPLPQCRRKTGSCGKTIHAIIDNYAAHKHPNVRRWLERNPRWTFHFTPTSASWLNAVEGFFATLTKRRLKRGVFRSVTDLQAAINRFLEEHNQQSQPFTWTADPDKIIAAVRRGHQVLDSIH